MLIAKKKMPPPKRWYLRVDDGKIFMYKVIPGGTDARLGRGECLGGKSLTAAGETATTDIGPILDARTHSAEKVKFRFFHGDPRAKAITNFCWEKSPLSKKFQHAGTAQSFIGIWNEVISPHLNSDTGDYTPPTNEGQDIQHSETSPQPRPGSKRKQITPTALEPLLPKRKKKGKESGSSEDSKMDSEIDSHFCGFHQIPVSCLIEPQKVRLLREPDTVFIQSLKKEMKQNPLSITSPIVGLVHLRAGEPFDDKHPSSFVYEIIGGNNSRIALQELGKSDPTNEHYKVRMVTVYSNLSDHLALRLASRHNRATDFTHSLTTQDKVETCRQQLSLSVSNQEWRKSCAAILSQPVTKLDNGMILFLSSLPADEYDVLLTIFSKFEKCELKDQSLTCTQRNAAKASKLDCKGFNFKCLRGLTPATRLKLLCQLRDGEISLAELSSSSRYAKRMALVQASFLRYHSLESWEEAKEVFPVHTKPERLEAFITLPFRGSTMPPAFLAYCKEAKKVLHSAPVASDAIEITSGDRGEKVVAHIRQQVVLTISTDEVLKTASNFPGFTLVIVDMPQSWTDIQLSSISRLIRSVNATTGIQTYTIAVVCKPEAITTVTAILTRDFTYTQIAFHKSADVTSSTTCNHQLPQSVNAIVMGHWTVTGEYSVYQSQSHFEGNFIDNNMKEGLINLLSLPGQWVLDALGTSTLETVKNDRNVITFQENPEKHAEMLKLLLACTTDAPS